MRILHNACVALLGLLLWSVGQAADSSDTPRQYDIELLIFQNLVQGDAGEVWPRDYSTWFDEAAGQPGAPAPAAPDVTWLPESSYHLKAERDAMRRSRGYRPLAYLAWRQTLVERNQALPLQLPAADNRNAAYVDGTVRVAVERYLHLYLDLQLHLPAAALSAQIDAPDAELPEIRLTEQRRMRSNELHYFDNPRFGVIALITPYEPPPEPAAVSAPATPQVATPDAGAQPPTAP
ncbi:MAG: CsiV family protein [Thiogranum sp.]|jgi:hypothetical protein